MTTGIVTDSRYKTHDDPQHVERAERLRAIERALDAEKLWDDLLAIEPRAAHHDELIAVHERGYLERIQRFGIGGGGYIDPDTYMNESSWEVATLAAGGAICAVDAVLGGRCDNAFALVRPPGHHATSNQAMGFCLINNVAVAARYAQTAFGLDRVAIMDYDVHHGNGTQDIFYQDGQILYSSTHAFPFYPGTGGRQERGSGDGLGATFNVPLPLGLGDKGYERVFAEAVIPSLRAWKPQLLLVSAGFDAHWSDPIGPMILSVSGYCRLTQMLYDLAAEVCGGHIVLFLEGGYNLDAISACTVGALRVLLQQESSPDTLGSITATEPDVSALLAAIQKEHPLLAHVSGG